LRQVFFGDLEVVKDSAKEQASSVNDRFAEFEKRMTTMEWDLVAQHAENDRLSAAMAKLIDRNWSQDKKLDNALDRIRELENRVKATEDLLKESHLNQTALDVEVIGLQQRVTELESEMKWTKGITDQHSESFDDFGAQVKELESFAERQEAYNQCNNEMTRGLSGRLLWSFRHRESLAVRISDLEEEVQLESHCSHCPASELEIERGPLGWTARTDTIQWPTHGDVERAIQEDEEMVEMRMRQMEEEIESEISEEAYELASPATTRSMSLRPVLPSEIESEVDGAGISTRETTPGPDENVVPLPVVRGVIRSASRVRPGPYSLVASTRQLHVDPTIVRHYVTTIVRGWSTRRAVAIGTSS